MEEETLTLNGELFFFIKHRRRGGAVYRNALGTHYARVGEKDENRKEASLLRELHTRGFPTPEVLYEAVLDDTRSFFIESAVGIETYGKRFEQETTLHNTISDATFAAFLETLGQYATAQYKKENWFVGTPTDVEHTIDLDNVLRNTPPSSDEASHFFEALTRIQERVRDLPFCFSQSDLNAYNILEGGVIDFEHACRAPLGFDTVTSIFAPDFWPPISRRFTFSEKQVHAGLKVLARVGEKNQVPSLHNFRDEFLVLKAIRATAKSKESEEHPACNPSFWQWRTRVRAYAINAYLTGTPIDSRVFLEIGGSVKTYPEHHGH